MATKRLRRPQRGVLLPEKMREKMRSRTSLPNSEHDFYQRDVKGHFGCVNSVEFSHNELLLASGGDDLRVFVWNVNEMMCDEVPTPSTIMQGKHFANIFTYAWSNNDEHLYSAGNDGRIILHNMHTGAEERSWTGQRAVYNLCCSPVDENLVAASRDNGCVIFYDSRAAANEAFVAVKNKSPRNAVYSGQFNPVIPHMFAVCADGSDSVAIYDTRNFKKKLIDFSRFAPHGCMYGDWNSNGQCLAVNRARDYPLVFNMLENRVIRLRDLHYKSFHTIKSAVFTDDDVVMMGSDDFGIYGWWIADPNPTPDPIRRVEGMEVIETIPMASCILKGHRSIVNHVRYNKSQKVLASCGIEKIVKLWSPMEMHTATQHPELRDISRSVRVLNDMMVMVNRDEEDPSAAAAAADGEENAEEDIQMLQYFDDLVANTRNAPMGGNNPHIYLLDSSDEDDERSGQLFNLFMAGEASGEDEDEDTLSLESDAGSSDDDDDGERDGTHSRASTRHSDGEASSTSGSGRAGDVQLMAMVVDSSSDSDSTNGVEPNRNGEEERIEEITEWPPHGDDRANEASGDVVPMETEASPRNGTFEALFGTRSSNSAKK